jgi:Glycosyl hydrolases family 6
VTEHGVVAHLLEPGVVEVEPATVAGQPADYRRQPAWVAALLWIKDPGESDGRCGDSQTYMFDPPQARNLIMNTTRLSVT